MKKKILIEVLEDIATEGVYMDVILDNLIDGDISESLFALIEYIKNEDTLSDSGE